MKRVTLLLGLLACTLSWAGIQAVHHLSKGMAQAARVIGNIREHMAANPKDKSVVAKLQAHERFVDQRP